MNKIYFPAIFHAEEEGYSVAVPDLNGCFTQGENLEHALAMAQDAIGLYLDGSKTIMPSAPQSISVPQGDFLMLIAFDNAEYLRRQNNKAVKKTLTIPAWLNVAAEEQHINFSSVLQTALKQQLNIK